MRKILVCLPYVPLLHISMRIGERLSYCKWVLDDVASGFLAADIVACDKSVRRVQFIPHEIEGAVPRELFNRDGIGTSLRVGAFDEIRWATIGDIGGILELSISPDEEGVLVKRTREKLEEEIDHYSVFLRDGFVIACGALYCDDDEKIAEVSSLVAAEEYRNKSIGKRLLAHLEKNARSVGMQRIFLLTVHAMHWFQEQGFTKAAIGDLPMAQQKLYDYRRNSKVLLKNID